MYYGQVCFLALHLTLESCGCQRRKQDYHYIVLVIEKISSSTLGNLLCYVAIIGVLLLLTTIIRLKIPVLRKMFIPASLLAGFIGLFLGSRFTGVIPPDMMSSIGSFPSHMITVVFTCMLLGVKKTEITKDLARDTVSSLFY